MVTAGVKGLSFLPH